jgi:hypothetical protein
MTAPRKNFGDGRMPILNHWLLACLCLLLVSAAAFAQKVEVIQNFADDASLDAWTAVDRATIRVQEGHLTLTKPKYEGGDAQWPRAERDVKQWDFSRFNGVELTVENPNDASQELDVIVRDGKGADAYLSTTIESRARRTVRLRFANAYNDTDWSDIRQLAIMRTTPDMTYVWHVHDLSLFQDDPNSTPRAAATLALARAAEAMAQAESLMDEAAREKFRNEIDAWRQRINSADGLRGRLSEARVSLASLAADAMRVKATRDAGSQADPMLLAWSVVPGQTFRPTEAMLQYREPAKQIAIQAAKDEYGEALLRLTNVGTATQDLRVTMRDPEGAAFPSLSIRRIVPVLARDGTPCGDALAPLDASGVVTLPAQETVELWIRADVRHAEWPAGTHRFTLEARDLRRANGPVTSIPVDVTILDVDLAKATPMRAHHWPEITHARSWPIHGREDAARANLVDYGSNTTTLVDDVLPWPKFSADGTIESIDFTRHDEVVRLERQQAPIMLLFWLAMDSGKENNWSLQAGLEPGSETWKRALANWLTAWGNHLGELGLTTEDFAFYVTDEPNREEYNRTLLFAEVAKSVNPKFKMYVNGSHDVAVDPAKAERLFSLVDIWQPDETWQAESLKQALVSHRHIERWVYRCSMARRNYDVNAHDYYRLMAWRAMRDGVKGIAYWTYCATHPGEDPWDGTKGTASGGIMIYPDAQKGLIMSARWELVRMSLDDARYADLLRKATPSDTVQQQAIDTLLKDRMTEIIENPDQPERVAQWRIDAGKLLEAMAD